jgi:acetylornithine deacetylase/succinyl-diaminopimelate desuccinylase-like protein
MSHRYPFPFLRRPVSVLGAAVAVAMSAALSAAAQTRPAPPIAHEITQTYARLLASPVIRKLLDDIRADDARTLAEHRQLTEIEAPPFAEKARAEVMLQRFRALGLADAAIDAEGNVVGLRKGVGSGPLLVVSAHLDTVFPAGTDVRIKEREGRLYAPGIADDTRGLAVLLAWIKALNENGIRTTGDILFVANVGEEGLGDLRGMKRVFKDRPGIDGMVGIEPSPMNSITSIGTGSHRYEVTFRGPGGHSFEAFGAVSAIHAMGRAIAKIAEIRTPAEPKTTFTVGTVTGGTSVNTIAGDAKMQIDMRSNGMASLLALEKQVLATLPVAVAEENARWGADTPAKQVGFTTKLIGDRPAGETAPSAVIVQAAVASLAAFGGGGAPMLSGSSTDANVPMSLAIPAIIVGGGGESLGWHTRDEWFDPKDEWKGAQQSLTTILGLVGVQGLVEPILRTRAPR